MISVFLLGLIVGLVFVYPAYLFGRTEGIKWATKKTQELLEQYGMGAFNVK